MAYVCLGFSHETAPLEVRDKLNLESDFLSAKLSDFVLLSTCKRVEIYTSTNSFSSMHQNGDTAYELLKTVSDHCQIDILTLNRLACLYFDNQAAEHLFHIAAGLKSQIIGESEILGQVTKAVQHAEQGRHLNDSLRELFWHALKVGRRARTDAISVNEILCEELAEFLTHPKQVSPRANDGLDSLEDIRVSELKKIQASGKLERQVCNLMDQFSKNLVRRIAESSAKSDRQQKQLKLSGQDQRKDGKGSSIGFDFEPPFSWGLESDSNPAD